MKIYLASASPRRKELLSQIGLEFEVLVSNIQEKSSAAEPGKVVEELSQQKARAVLEELERRVQTNLKEPGQKNETEAGNSERVRQIFERDILVIGADTIVASGPRILGKPADAEEAAQMLRLLSGSTHEVYTGVTLLHRTSDGVLLQKTFHEMTRVTFFPMSEREIARYISTGDCLDKAGAYGIQGLCARYISGIEGDYNNVVGLPVGRLYQEAKEWLKE